MPESSDHEDASDSDETRPSDLPDDVQDGRSREGVDPSGELEPRIPNVGNAVQKALADAAAQAASTPDVTRAIREAVRQQTTGLGLGLSGLGGLGSSGVDSAVQKALTNAAAQAVNTPELDRVIRRAARQQVIGLSAYGTDPAIALRLAQLERSWPAVDTEHEDAETTRRTPAKVVKPDGPFSDAFSGPDAFFATHEVVVDSFESLTQEVALLARANPTLRFVWRGQRDANWGLHSSLYRRLLDHYGTTTFNDGGAATEQRFPDESAMLQAELAILDEAAIWRMSEVSALEVLARLQHQGGPTRLLDVTRNPLIAAWFAAEDDSAESDDARLFAIATTPVKGDRSSDPTLEEVLAAGRYPFWTFGTDAERQDAEWGTGARRRLWIPPAYDARIAAQNAAFLLEGVPTFTRDTLRLFKRADGRSWTAAEVAASTSVYAKPADPHKRARPNGAGVAPLFTFRLKAHAKPVIRRLLADIYGYSAALIYPDIQGLSDRLKQSDWLPAAPE